MLNFLENHSLKNLNTFGLDVKAAKYYKADSVSNLTQALRQIQGDKLPCFVLGGGSNILFKDNFPGIIIQPNIVSIELTNEDDDSATIEVGAGVEWDDLVNQMVSQGLGGIENLSLIPGSVGAAPIQNIGAYGVEVKDSIVAVRGVYRDGIKYFELSNKDCEFGYRDSIFKNKLKNKTVITHVVFKLYKKPALITHYGNLDIEIERLGGKTLQNVREAVINIRNSKLPDPKELGNAGSFFKNPVVDISLVEDLESKFEKVPYYPVSEKQIKLPAGWLIEQSGWKGKRKGNVGVHKDQALVIVNYGGATGEELVELAHEVRQSVMEKFNISLEMEVNVV